MAETGYCVKCKSKQEMTQTKLEKTKRGGDMLKGICKKCGTKMVKFVKKEKK